LLNHNEVKSYFTEDWEVKTEKEILMQNGKTYIPDRLLFSKNTDEVVVIDYKTGVRQKKHIQQISEYAIALEEMGKSNIRKVLIYTSEPVKVEVL
jgi:CRISPR/Cas system-associated exonuclease Cas4 (RecB family)